MNEHEQASQLSAMFDGELSAAECELLSRRLARDEQLRATWSRYAVIGAVLRAEPLAQVRPDFARRVSAALVGPPASAGLRRALRGAALGSVLAASVAGVAILMLRNDLPVQEQVLSAVAPTVARTVAPAVSLASFGGSVNLRMSTAAAANSSHELFSYVVPPLSSGNSGAVPASLADYVVAHSEVPSSLARASLLSVLVGNQSVQPAPDNLLLDGGH
ncbi:MAG TPA: sigma-E factor negative regulatory protein [Steroidobacteraceae bacterium]|nr:sigma-E factor negative regulatory protein [Steroidobacteraceae bacterium]